MESFKDDKVAVLHQIDSMEENSTNRSTTF